MLSRRGGSTVLLVNYFLQQLHDHTQQVLVRGCSTQTVPPYCKENYRVLY
jgi:hypothetical protein